MPDARSNPLRNNRLPCRSDASEHRRSSTQSAQLSPPKGIIFDIQRAALHDGPGLRTTVFLKGCPLRCAWCHNPESWKVSPQIGFSGKVYGTEMTVEAVMEVVRADRSYYANSGGGITLSGGEPTFQFDFCKALLQAARSEGIHTCLDTCGQVEPERLRELLPFVDLFHFDWKLSDPKALHQWTQADAPLIRSNLQLLLDQKAPILLRCPIIPGVNQTPEHLAAIEQWSEHPGIKGVESLPYHPTGMPKFRDLGMDPHSFT